MAKDFTVKSIPLSQIDPAINREIKQENVDKLKTDIQEYGLFHPIGLVKKPDGSGYRIAFGGHRYHAYKQLNEAGVKDENGNDYSSIPAKIMDISVDEIGFTQIMENLTRSTQTATQTSEMLRRLMAMPAYSHMSKADFLAKLGMKQSPQWLDKTLSLNELIEPAQVLVDNGKINISKAYDLAMLPPEEQIDWIEKAQSAKVEDFKRDVNERLLKIKQEKRGEKATDSDPLRLARRRSLTELKQKFVELEIQLSNSNIAPNERIRLGGYYEGLQYSISLDAETRAQQEAEKKAAEAKNAEVIKRRKELLANLRKQVNEQVEKEFTTASA